MLLLVVPALGAAAKSGAEEGGCGTIAHPSGNDRLRGAGGLGHAGSATSVPDDGGRGPDGSNGGVDRDGGDGGVNTADQDGNNGCGNDQDFEDDNEGLCGGNPDRGAAAANVEAKTAGVQAKDKAADTKRLSGRAAAATKVEADVEGSRGPVGPAGVARPASPAHRDSATSPLSKVLWHRRVLSPGCGRR